MKYLIKHWLNLDCIAEAIADESEIDVHRNDLKEYSTPKNEKFKINIIEGNEKIVRTTFEQYDEKLISSSKEPSSNK